MYGPNSQEAVSIQGKGGGVLDGQKRQIRRCLRCKTNRTKGYIGIKDKKKRLNSQFCFCNKAANGVTYRTQNAERRPGYQVGSDESGFGQSSKPLVSIWCLIPELTGESWL